MSLARAIELALAGNSGLAIAEARREIAVAQGRSTAAPLWPQLALQSGYTRSTDPVFAFGTKLRQARFGADDFDVTALNDPSEIGDWSTTISLRWSVVDPSRWASRASARDRADAASWQLVRAREATVLVTRTLYHRAQAAAAHLEASRSAEIAAQATRDSFARRRERGLLTQADLLGAEAELAAARARRTESERLKLDAVQQLGLHLGWSADSLPTPTDSLAEPTPLSGVRFDPNERADLRALSAAVNAANAARRQARLSFVPALDAFAGYATHDPDPVSLDENDWSFGLMLRWVLFSGFGRQAELQRVGAQSRIAAIEYEQALRDARSEVEQTERAVVSAGQQVEATRSAWDAAVASRQLMHRRFEEGLATANDLLQAEARANDMRDYAINALANYHIAVARLEFARSQPITNTQR